MNTDKIQEVVNNFFVEQGWVECFLVEIRHKEKNIEVFVDCDGGINLAKCHKISRAIESYLDESKDFGENYTLDVSSPGVGTPLKLYRQYVNNIGRTIEIKTDIENIEGELREVNELGVTVYYIEKKKEGKKNVKVEVERPIKFEEIINAKIKVSFK